MSPMIWVQYGPATFWVRSATRIPASGASMGNRLYRQPPRPLAPSPWEGEVGGEVGSVVVPLWPPLTLLPPLSEGEGASGPRPLRGRGEGEGQLTARGSSRWG